MQGTSRTEYFCEVFAEETESRLRFFDGKKYPRLFPRAADGDRFFKDVQEVNVEAAQKEEFILQKRIQLSRLDVLTRALFIELENRRSSNFSSLYFSSDHMLRS